jgi:hypothetical protein
VQQHNPLAVKVGDPTLISVPSVAALMVGIMPARNWCGRQKAIMVAPAHASARSGVATTFGVNWADGRYLTLQFCSLISSVRLRPSTCSSCTYILTSGSKMSGLARAFEPRMRVRAEPKLPEPIMAIFSFCAAAVEVKLRAERVADERVLDNMVAVN